MKKLLFLALLMFCVTIAIAQPSQYTPMTAQGYQFKRILTDSTLHLPSFCGVPNLRNSTAKNGAIAIDTCSGKVYRWTNQAGWDEVGAGGVDSIYKSSDSVYYTKGGNIYFAFKDSTGASISQDLQDVTDNGSTTTNTITIGKNYGSTLLGQEEGTINTPFIWMDNYNLGSYFKIQSDLNIGFPMSIIANGYNGGSYYISAIDSANNKPKLNINSTGDFININSNTSSEYIHISPSELKSQNTLGNASTRLKFANDNDNPAQTYIFSNHQKGVDSFYVPIRINGQFADATGDVILSIPSQSSIIDSLKRNPGTDSVFAQKNGSWIFQYKDSIGSGGSQTGRFGNDTATVVMAKIHNNSGTQLTNGKVVFLATSGTNSEAPSVRLANNKHDSTSANTFGFVSGTINANDTGYVILSGKIEKLNTSAFSNGDVIYLDSVSGQWTKTKPVAPYHMVYLGVVIKANAGNGSIFVKCQNGYELDEIHDVQITNKLNNQIIVYSDTQKVWKNRSIYSIVDTTNIIATKTNVAAKVNISDTASMLANYVRNTPSVAYLNSDFTTSSTTGVSSNLSIAVAANTAYRIMISGTASKATSSTGLKIGLSGPTGATIKANFNYCTNSINTQNNTFITAFSTLYPAAANFSTAIATEMPFRIEGIIVTGANAGNIVLQGATVTSNTATIYANTLMTITKAYAQ